MRVIIDADACPRMRFIRKECKDRNIQLHLFHNYIQEMGNGYGTCHPVPDGADSADFAIMGFCTEGDIVVTDDRGLASMVTAKKAVCITNSGHVYRDDEILGLLSYRHISKQLRAKGDYKTLGRKKHKLGMKTDSSHKCLAPTIIKADEVEI